MTKSAKDKLPELFIEYYCKHCNSKFAQKKVIRIRCRCGEMAGCSGIVTSGNTMLHAPELINAAAYLPGQLVLFEEGRRYAVSVSQLVHQ